LVYEVGKDGEVVRLKDIRGPQRAPRDANAVGEAKVEEEKPAS
jgi:hypothetical protein